VSDVELSEVTCSLSHLSSACMRDPGVQYISAKNTVEAAVRVIATPSE
jgi:hypothetical protein